MGPLTTEDIGWYRIDDPAPFTTARRAAAEAGRRIGLSDVRLGELNIIVAEMTSNLVKHANDGSLLLRYLYYDGIAGLELVAVDSGPGMADMARSGRDGHSTAGTLGLGLGTISRLATRSDSYSLPGRGTVLVVEVWPDSKHSRAKAAAAHDTIRDPALVDAPVGDGSVGDAPRGAGGLTRPITGETVCGDRFAIRYVPTGVLLMLADGLGHGPLAGAAADVAVAEFLAESAEAPAALLEALHGRMRHTRGAAVGIAAIDRSARTVRFAGLGNITVNIVQPGERRSLTCMPGIVGHQRRTVREFSADLPKGSAVVLHTDGLTDRWTIDDYPTLLSHTPVVIAATLLRDAGLRRDDAGIVVGAPS